MIKPTDLKIGNWVMYDGKFYKIELLSKQYPLLHSIELWHYLVYYENISGIPLTNEIISKNKINEMLNALNLELTISECGKYFDFYKAKKWIFSIKYVHELQNIFPFLTGFKLDIKL